MILLAGAWTDTGWPDTMEGAVRSGVAAAEAAAGTPPHETKRFAA
jgi:monoamine oxidase